MKTATKRPVRLRTKMAPMSVASDEPRDLMLDAFGWAVAAFEEATEHARQAYDRYKASPNYGQHPSTKEDHTWEQWTNHCQGVVGNAEESLIEAVLLASGRVRCFSEIKGLGVDWSPCAVEYKSAFYVVFQDGDYRSKPRLVIVASQALNADWMSES